MINVGIVTYGNTKYTRLAIRGVLENLGGIKIDNFVVVVGKPNDHLTKEYLKSLTGIKVIVHNENMGFPYSINDIYDAVWKHNHYPLLILGNDVVPLPGSIKRLVEYQKKTDADWVSGVEYLTPKILIKDHPNFDKYFKVHKQTKALLLKKEKADRFYAELKSLYNSEFHASLFNVSNNLNSYKVIGDSHNLTLFSYNLFKKIGYVDVNFYPAYFEDNDYAKRAQSMSLMMRQIRDAHYFHFWSRTIKEGGLSDTNEFYFPKNKKYYISKWGGEPGKEKWDTPHDEGNAASCICTRDGEEEIVRKWRDLRK